MTEPGKYDDLCTKVREEANAAAVVLIIFDGNKGHGFSCQAPVHLTLTLPQILRELADGIESDNNTLKESS